MRFEILGPIRALLGEREVIVTARREQTLLAMLLVHANRMVSSDQLIDAIWPTTVPQDARNQLQLCVGRLRRRLAEAGGDRNTIATDHGGYRISVDPDQFDAELFRRLVAEARASQEPEHAAEAYRSALALWRGPALADIESPAIRHTATVLDDEHAQVTEECIETELSLGKARELLPQLQQLIQRHPYREKLHGAYMLALYRAGRYADALAAYREVHRLLRDELGVAPGRELQDLHKAILNRDPSLDTPPPSSTTAPIPRELPADVAGFTGRVDALKALDALLPDGQNPTGPVVISAIAGTAGVGKTALAVHWAHRAADRFQDGQLYINLRGYAAGAPLRPIEALSTLLRSLGLPPDQVPTKEPEASARYRSLLADRRVLIVLDNARSVDQIRPLLPGGPGCLALITSRDKLAGLVARDGARRITLDVLPPREAYELLTQMLGADRVQAEPAATAELAKACAYLPLALRIAAAMLYEQPGRRIEDLTAELAAGHRLGALEVEGDQETAVRATFDLSYSGIPEPAQRLFRLLGLVPGPDFTPEAAGALADLPLDDTKQLLDRLASAHLVTEHAPGRYTFHDLLREYAHYRVQNDDTRPHRTAALDRLLRWFLATMESMRRLLSPHSAHLPLPADIPMNIVTPFADRAEALAWTETERANLVAAVRYAADHGPRRYAWLIADRLRAYFLRRTGVDSLTVGQAALSAAQIEGDARGEAAAHLVLGDGYIFSVCDPDLASAHHLRAAELAEGAGWLSGQSTAENNAALAFLDAGRLQESAKHLSRALQINQALGRISAMAGNLGNLGSVNYQLGRLSEARYQWSQALEIYREAADTNAVAITHANLGSACWLLGDLDAAVEHLNEALLLHRETGNRFSSVFALRSLAVTHCDLGRYEQALEHARAALGLIQGRGESGEEAYASNALAAVQRLVGEHQAAVRSYDYALHLGERQPYALAEALIGLAAVRHDLGEDRTALNHLDEALGIARRMGFHVLEGQAQVVLAEIHMAQGDLTGSREIAKQALENHRETGHTLGQARALAVLGRSQARIEGMSSAQSLLREAADLFRRTGAQMPADVARALNEHT